MTPGRPPRDAVLSDTVTISNEFASVRLSIDRRGKDHRLRIDDLRNDISVTLDAFQLACLAGTDEITLSLPMDPERRARPTEG